MRGRAELHKSDNDSNNGLKYHTFMIDVKRSERDYEITVQHSLSLSSGVASPKPLVYLILHA